jgi:hypothetical protein
VNVYGNVRAYTPGEDVFGNVFGDPSLIIIVSVYVAEMDVFTSHTQAMSSFAPYGVFDSSDGIIEMQVT